EPGGRQGPRVRRRAEQPAAGRPRDAQAPVERSALRTSAGGGSHVRLRAAARPLILALAVRLVVFQLVEIGEGVRMARLVVMYKTPRHASAFDKDYVASHVPIPQRIPRFRKPEGPPGD